MRIELQVGFFYSFIGIIIFLMICEIKKLLFYRMINEQEILLLYDTRIFLY